MIVYSKENCPACDKMIAKLTSEQREFSVVKIGVDISLEEFLKTFPSVRTVPFVVDVAQYGS